MIHIAHITDAHFKNADDPTCSRTELVSNCILSRLTTESTHLILLFNGDHADKGKSDGFQHAEKFIRDLSSLIRPRLNKGCGFSTLINCGNHDLSFATDQTMRDLAIQSLTSPIRPSSSVETVVLEPLGNYFEFASHLSDISPNSIGINSPYTANILVKDQGKSARILLLNSSWMSRHKEKANEATFPLPLLDPIVENPADFTLLAMHHPVVWFKMPDTQKQLRDWIHQHCDALLTGHEHSSYSHAATNETINVINCEGGAFEESGVSDPSSFQLIDVNLETRKLICDEYVFSTQKYYELKSSQSHDIKSAGQRLQPRRLKKEYLAFLQDPQLPIKTPNKQLKLQDFYLYPDFKEYDLHSDESIIVASERLFSELDTSRRILFTGSERAGKTALVRRLVLDLHSAGKLPIFLEGKPISKLRNIEQYREYIKKMFHQQYDELTYDAVVQKYHSDLCIIVDDFHEVYTSVLGPSVHVQIMEQLSQRCIFVSSDEISLLEAHDSHTSAGLYTSYRRLEICEFGQLRLEALAVKWLKISETQDKDVPLAKDVRNLTKQIQNVLAAEVIPHQPWILIILLQQSVEPELFVSNGSYALMYQAIITANLSKSKLSSLEMNGKFAYLGNLAYRIFESGDDRISIETARKIHDQHCQTIDIPIDFNDVMSDFETVGILRIERNEVSVRSKYAICFFLAWHLNKNLHNSWAMEKVKNLCQLLFDPIAGNTLLFLSHLSSSPFVIETVREAASALFADSPIATLEADVNKLNSLGGTTPKISLPDTSSDNNREEFVRSKEEAQGIVVSTPANNLQMVGIVDPDEREGRHIPAIHEIQAAYKMIRILGQILKNEADTTDSAKKTAILSEVFRLSRRMLGSAFSELDDPETWARVVSVKLVAGYRNRVKGKKYLESRKAENRLLIKAEREIVHICFLASITIIKTVAESTGSQALASTFAKVIESDPCAINRLFQLDVLMEHLKEFPISIAMQLKEQIEGNAFSMALLNSLVAHRFYLYRTEYREKQMVCDKLGIGLDNNRSLSPDRKNRAPDTIKRLGGKGR